MRNLTGEPAIVTGAASGVGLGIVRALAGAGANAVTRQADVSGFDRGAAGRRGFADQDITHARTIACAGETLPN
jgi:NAD(P)-dependent dehydrogenase (short-subunit alcohol dehydrogenase family)